VKDLAFSKKHKVKMVDEYKQWLRDSQGVFMLSYAKMSMKDIDAFRARVRDAGGRAHVIKNTLLDLALERVGYSTEKPLEGTTLVGFAQEDVPALAKVFSDVTNKSEIFELKGGFLNGQVIRAKDVKSLAELPPLPVMRARLLGVIMAPASQLARTLAEPARQVAAVVKAYSEKEATPAA